VSQITVPGKTETGSAIGSIFYFLAFFFRNISSNTPLTKRFQEIDPGLGAIRAGAKVAWRR
jgi:hypothetical protein